MLKQLTILVGAVVLLTGPAVNAAAATVGYKVVLSSTDRYQSRSDSFNFPVFKLINRSTSASIMDFVVSIGDHDFNLDVARDERQSGGIGFDLIEGDSLQQGERWERICYSFNSFGPGGWFQFESDVDPNHRNRVLDYQKVLMDIGGDDAGDNVGFRVTFSDDTVLEGNLSDPDRRRSRYAFSQSIYRPDVVIDSPPAIPLPPAAAMAVVTMGALAAARGLKKRRWFV